MHLLSTSELKQLTRMVWRMRRTLLAPFSLAISQVSRPVSHNHRKLPFFRDPDLASSYNEHLHWRIHWPAIDLQRSVHQHDHPEELSSAIDCVDCEHTRSVYTLHQGRKQVPRRLVENAIMPTLVRTDCNAQ